MKTPFTQEEKDFLVADGWEVCVSLAYKNYRKISKVQENEIEVDTWVDGDAMDSNYWEWDSTHTSLEKAVKYCNRQS